MAEGFILQSGTLTKVFIYEGERVAVEYPDGTTYEIPSDKVHMVLTSATHPSGEPCHVLMEKSPITRLPIVLVE